MGVEGIIGGEVVDIIELYVEGGRLGKVKNSQTSVFQLV